MICGGALSARPDAGPRRVSYRDVADVRAALRSCRPTSRSSRAAPGARCATAATARFTRGRAACRLSHELRDPGRGILKEAELPAGLRIARLDPRPPGGRLAAARDRARRSLPRRRSAPAGLRRTCPADAAWPPRPACAPRSALRHPAPRAARSGRDRTTTGAAAPVRAALRAPTPDPLGVQRWASRGCRCGASGSSGLRVDDDLARWTLGPDRPRAAPTPDGGAEVVVAGRTLLHRRRRARAFAAPDARVAGRRAPARPGRPGPGRPRPSRPRWPAAATAAEAHRLLAGTFAGCARRCSGSTRGAPAIVRIDADGRPLDKPPALAAAAAARRRRGDDPRGCASSTRSGASSTSPPSAARPRMEVAATHRHPRRAAAADAGAALPAPEPARAAARRPAARPTRAAPRRGAASTRSTRSWPSARSPAGCCPTTSTRRSSASTPRGRPLGQLHARRRSPAPSSGRARPAGPARSAGRRTRATSPARATSRASPPASCRPTPPRATTPPSTPRGERALGAAARDRHHAVDGRPARLGRHGGRRRPGRPSDRRRPRDAAPRRRLGRRRRSPSPTPAAPASARAGRSPSSRATRADRPARRADPHRRRAARLRRRRRLRTTSGSSRRRSTARRARPAGAPGSSASFGARRSAAPPVQPDQHPYVARAGPTSRSARGRTLRLTLLAARRAARSTRPAACCRARPSRSRATGSTPRSSGCRRRSASARCSSIRPRCGCRASPDWATARRSRAATRR